jgi:hypothetical protein
MTTKELISKTHQRGVAVAHQIAQLTRLEKGLEAINRRRRKATVATHKPQFSMFDSVDLSQIPPGAGAVAGYVGGKWPTYNEVVKRFPNAKHLSIAINATEDAECLDVETGDATPAEVPAWVHRQQSRGVKRPVLYANFSTMPQVLAALASAGIDRHLDVRLWVAEYTYTAHIPLGYDACQWTDRSGGRNLDQSLCLGTFL